MSMFRREKRTSAEEIIFKHGGQAALDKHRAGKQRRADQKAARAVRVEEEFEQAVHCEISDADIIGLQKALQTWHESVKQRKTDYLGKFTGVRTRFALGRTSTKEDFTKLYDELLVLLGQIYSQVTVENIRAMEGRLSELESAQASIGKRLAMPMSEYNKPGGKSPIGIIAEKFLEWERTKPLDEKMILRLCDLQKGIIEPLTSTTGVKHDSHVDIAKTQIEALETFVFQEAQKAKQADGPEKAEGKVVEAKNEKDGVQVKLSGATKTTATAYSRVVGLSESGFSAVNWTLAQSINDLHQKYRQSYEKLKSQERAADGIRQAIIPFQQSYLGFERLLDPAKGRVDIQGVHEGVIQKADVGYTKTPLKASKADAKGLPLLTQFMVAKTAQDKIEIIGKAIAGLRAIEVPETVKGHDFVFKPFLDKLIEQEAGKLQKMQKGVIPSAAKSLMSRLSSVGAGTSADGVGSRKAASSKSSWLPGLTGRLGFGGGSASSPSADPLSSAADAFSSSSTAMSPKEGSSK